METKMKRSSRSAMRGGTHSRRSSSRNKEVNCLTSTTSTVEAAAIGTSKNALRERSRVESLRRAYLELQAAIPSVPPNTKLSKLDVLMLATTYISHLTQLLQEDDDARKSHDDNNNDTSCAEDAAGGGGANRESSCAMQDVSPQKMQQKGLLHPVKKWPMRARLYADVGAAEAGHLLIEPVRVQTHSPFQNRTDRMLSPYQTTSLHAGSHLQPRMSTSFHHPHPTVHVQCKPHPSLVPFTSCGSSYDASTNHLDEFTTRPQDTLGGKPLSRAHFHHGRWNQAECFQRNGGQQCIPAANFPGYANTWHPDMGWDSYLTYNDLNACQAQCHVSQSMNGFSGCWTAWNA
ncbi:uncharacterized protein LOC135210321 isoform X2 [Macrobrachium nipponense]|uniref:uncharacterized protein LOC135210321 isoform X2 n=1 Tax=Macrobrachium nipponense TaxID=159736 RepID=UPI0030C7E53E